MYDLCQKRKKGKKKKKRDYESASNTIEMHAIEIRKNLTSK